MEDIEGSCIQLEPRKIGWVTNNSGVAGAFFRGCTPATLPYVRWVGSIGSVETDA